MSELLKGNFSVKKPVHAADGEASRQDGPAQALAERLKKAALASIGGSMVYMERTDLTWNGDDT
jgi:hypothetical protein